MEVSRKLDSTVTPLPNIRQRRTLHRDGKLNTITIDRFQCHAIKKRNKTSVSG